MTSGDMKRMLVIGAVGQIGSELTMELRSRYGNDNVVAMGRKTKPSETLLNSGPFEWGDVTDPGSIISVVEKHDIDTIYLMAAILSAVGEQRPQLAYDVNMNGLYNVLEIARERELTRVMVPSSIAAFGPETPKDNTPQETVLRPTTIYGVTKVAGELLADYYFKRFGVDVRGLRYPGIISSETLPGGGTTDYAVEIFYEAIKNKRYTCFVREDTALPMMYMPDCIRATIMLMEADVNKLKHHADFNVAGLSFSAGELAAEIKKHIPEFECTYAPDFRQQIADSWPRTIDDSAAREEWGWRPEYDLPRMVDDMIGKLTPRLT
jgi:nucleoside-diphosphate-sugar epimerase